MAPAQAIVPAFAPINRARLADQVRRQLEVSIRSGAFAPGALIPPEETLCREFGVSRPSVREAIREAIAVGLLERRANRVYVVEHLPSVRIETDERLSRIREVFETRRLIEVQLTEYAAERATDSQRAEITALADGFGAVSSVEQLRPLDRAFHAVIAAAASNALLAELHAKVLDAIFSTTPYDALLRDAADIDDAHKILATTRAMHRRIAGAVAAGDVAAAGAAARAHLDDVEQRMAERTFGSFGA
jgi:GntR family transcriptional repressor for pyruvate dehydrogenase complex